MFNRVEIGVSDWTLLRGSILTHGVAGTLARDLQALATRKNKKSGK